MGGDIDLGFNFVPGRNYTLTQQIKNNTGRNKDGILQVWVSENGGPQKRVLNKSNLRFGVDGKGQTDSFLISTFHGATRQNGRRRAPATSALMTSLSPLVVSVICKSTR